jgi:HEAT repeat protein
MDALNRFLALAVNFAGIVAIVIASYLAYRYYRQQTSRLGAVAAGPAANAPAAGERSTSRGAGGYQPHSQADQVRRLQALLDQKTALLQKALELLEQKNAEQQELRSELDTAIALLEASAAASKAGDTETPALRRFEASDRLQGELETLKTGAEKSRAAAESQQSALAELQLELVATDGKIAQLQQDAENQFVLLREQREAFETVVSATLVRLGEAAVPALIEHLSHPRADIRRWAATVLGRLGPAAKDALPPLVEVLGDKDPEVRAAVKHAVELIDVPSR